MGRKPLDTDSCPKTVDLEKYASNQLIGKRNEEIFLHLRHCTKCLRRMARIKKMPSPDEIIEGGSKPGWLENMRKLFFFWKK